MRVAKAILVSGVLSTSALANDCALQNAQYHQAEAGWSLAFKPVPEAAAGNQAAAFSLSLAASGVELDGAIFIPNGFGSPLWTLEGPCSPDTTERCSVLDENAMPSAYGVYGGKVRFLDAEDGAQAPEQLLLPQLAVSLWYSDYRVKEWSDTADPSDAFELIGCN